MTDSPTPEVDPSIDATLSKELGLDVAGLEIVARFELDRARMQRGEPGQLGYVFMDRQWNPDAAIVFGTAEEANVALEDNIVVGSLTQEDCLDAYVLDVVWLSDVASREIFLQE